MKQLKKSAAIIWAVILVIAIAGMSYLSMTYINKTTADEDGGIKLGLDLKGGVSITYQIKGEATEEAISDTINKLKSRIENDLGEEASTTEASVYKSGDDRITVEIPGVSDANAMLEQLGTPGTLYFIAQTDADGNENYSIDYNTYTYVLNYDIADLIANGSVICTGTDVVSAQAMYQTNQTTNASEPIVDLSFNDAGTKSFGDATTAAYASGETIGIYYDGNFVSVPNVNEPITSGKCVISGMGSHEAAEKLASYIRIGGLTVELEELQSEVVGAQLGSNALSTALFAAAIGLLLVIIFLIIMYRVPGVAASLALVLYTALLIAILQWYDLTLTLPGIAGMILSIGMAVDANVIIFARIREEIAAGKQVGSAIEAGYKKALSAIVDGNVTTLIAAAVLGAFGTGTIKGFAITLAIGVLLSMFTALVVTRLIMNIFFAFGAKSEVLYGRAKEREAVNFMSKKAVFFVASILVIAVGIVAMAVNGIAGNKSLNYNLEFMGGTSTTVGFNQEYTIDQLESDVVPFVSEITGDNNIQMQTIDGTNQVVFKTRTLNIEEREAMNAMLEEKFGVAEDSITAQSIGSTISSEMRRDSIIVVLVAVALMFVYITIRFKDVKFASSAIIALAHDVLVVLAIYAVARISVGNAFIACMLTVIGYSVNDTIVIFDRLRENAKNARMNKAEEIAKVANDSITQTLSRSISTSITTAIMVLMLLILGVSTIREFAFPLLCGVICGTYSSICIATELWYVFKVASLKKANK